MAGAQGRHRPIPDLIGETFGLIGRRFREVAVISIVAAAIAVISVALVSASSRIIEEEILENPRLEEYLDLLDDGLTAEEAAAAEEAASGFTPVNGDEVRVVSLHSDAAQSEAWEAFVDSVSWDRVRSAVLLFGAFLLVSIIGGATTVALSLVTLDDVEGRPSSPASALATGLARVPKIVLLTLLYLAAFLAMLAALGAVTVVAVLVHALLGLLALLVMIGVTIATLAVFAPLIEMHFVMAYVEPGFPSPAKWWRLLADNKLATWGRSALIIAANIVVGVVLWLSLQSLPSPYGDFISNAIAGPIIAAIMAIAFALMYADLSGRSRPTAGDWPELHN